MDSDPPIQVSTVLKSQPSSFPRTLELLFNCRLTFNRVWYSTIGCCSEDSHAKIVRANVLLYSSRIYERSKTEPIEDIRGDYSEGVRELYDTAMGALHHEHVTQWDDIARVRALLKLSTKHIPLIAGHSHQHRAHDRQVALETMEEIARTLQVPLYSVSTGPREDKRGWDGCREHYFPSDMRQRRRVDPIEPNHLIGLVDVDYYVGLELFERYAGHKFAIFTVEVDGVGGYDGESLWHVEGSTFHEHIAGGATWKHPVWSYSGAVCTVRDRKAAFAYHDEVTNAKWASWVTAAIVRPVWRWFAMREVERLHQHSGHVEYHVERIRFPGTNKMIVLLNPSFCSKLPWDFACAKFGVNMMERNLLTRVPAVTVHTTSRGSFRIGIFRGSRPYVSISYRAPTRHSLKLPLNEWESLVLRAKGVRSWGAEIVDQHMKQLNHKLSSESVMLLAAALIDVPENIHFVGYTADLDDMHDVEDVAKLVVPPVVPPATASAQSPADMAKAIDNFAAVRNTVVPPSVIRGYAKEFATEVAARTKWCMLSHDETIDAMLRSNPTRKAEIEKFLANPRNTETYVLATIKAECVPNAAEKGKKARIILPQSTYELYAATRFIKPWSEQAHKRGPFGCGHWFVCGSDPTEIAEAVVRAVLEAESAGRILTATDFAKFDLSHSAFTRDSFVDAVASSCLNSSGDIDVRTVLQWEVNKTIVPKVKNRRNHPKGEKVGAIKSGTMNLSGAADTTALNTYTNALLSYITARRLGFSHSEAFNNIRPKYGDDGLEEHVKHWEDTIKICGFNGTIETRESNDEPVAFLSRLYLQPMVTTTSICDPLRALMKLPTTCSPRPVYLARRDKALGYSIVDGKTPLVGNYARAILRVYGTGSTKYTLGPLVDPVIDPSPDGPVRCNSSEGRELKWKIDRGPHPYCDDFDDVAVSVVAERLGMCVEEVERLCDAYDAAKTPEDMIELASTEMSKVALGCRALRAGFDDLA